MTYPDLYSDAVQYRLEGKWEGSTPRCEIIKVLEDFQKKLTSSERRLGSNFFTGFPGVMRTPHNLYEIEIGHDETTFRDFGEAQLHVLLVANQRHRESIRNGTQGNTQTAASVGTQTRSSAHSPGSSTSINSLRGPAAPLPSAQSTNGPSRATAAPAMTAVRAPQPQVPSCPPPPKSPSLQKSPNAASSPPNRISRPDSILEYPDELNNPLRIFSSQAININTFDARINQSHHLKEISGATNGCWWRTAILSAILQHSPEALQEIIVRKLGSQFQNEAEALAKMARAVRELGPNAILTNTLPTKSLPENLRSPSSLKSPDMDDDSGKEIGEGICRIIAAALLERAGCSESERIRLFANAGMGSTEHIAAILRELDSDTVLFTNPWNTLSSTGPVTHDTAAANVTVCAGRERGVRDITNDPSVVQCTENLLQHTATTPILIHQGAHFNLAIPKEWFPVSPAHRN